MPAKLTVRRNIRIFLGAAAAVAFSAAALHAAGADFVTTVTSTHPVGYYRLDSTNGTSQTGATQYKAMGGVTAAGPGAPIGATENQYAKMDSHDGYIITTQAGGVGTAASIMAWVNMASLPSGEGHFFYVAGESQNGNDLDLQFENDNALRFYTASGGHLSYSPPPSTLINQWHMILATVNTATQSRVIYWDGKLVAMDKGGGQAGKTGLFSIGASTVFGGRFFKGGIEEAALWDRALTPAEVASIYAASKDGAAAAGPVAAAAPGTGPFATTAKVAVEDMNGQLKREEQIALMFVTAFQAIEFNCQFNLKRACPMTEVMQHLKFDPKTDPNYTYTLGAGGMSWESHATAKKPGLAGFYIFATGLGGPNAYYNRGGTASLVDDQLTSRSVDGDSFSTQ